MRPPCFPPVKVAWHQPWLEPFFRWPAGCEAPLRGRLPCPGVPWPAPVPSRPTWSGELHSRPRRLEPHQRQRARMHCCPCHAAAPSPSLATLRASARSTQISAATGASTPQRLRRRAPLPSCLRQEEMSRSTQHSVCHDLQAGFAGGPDEHALLKMPQSGQAESRQQSPKPHG